MSNTSKRRRPLVADKRYSKSAVQSKPPKKVPQKRRKPKRPVRGCILGFFLGLFRWVFRLIWNVIWRSSAVVFLILLLSVGYVFTTLPNLSALLDGRARG